MSKDLVVIPNIQRTWSFIDQTEDNHASGSEVRCDVGELLSRREFLYSLNFNKMGGAAGDGTKNDIDGGPNNPLHGRHYVAGGIGPLCPREELRDHAVTWSAE